MSWWLHPSLSKEDSRIIPCSCRNGNIQDGCRLLSDGPLGRTPYPDSVPVFQGRTGRSERCERSIWPSLRCGCCGWLAWACSGRGPESSQSQLCSAGRHPFHIEMEKKKKRRPRIHLYSGGPDGWIPPPCGSSESRPHKIFFSFIFNCFWWFSCLINRLWLKTAIGWPSSVTVSCCNCAIFRAARSASS